MVKRLITVVLCVAATGTLFSQSVQSPGKIYGAGATTCAAWLAGAKSSAPDVVQMSWVMGYLSAAGAPIKQEVDPVWIHGFLNGYCEKKAGLTLAAAAHEMVQFLVTRNR